LATFNCTKCGAGIDIDPGVKFAKCKYCDSQIFLDKSGVGFFYIIPFMLKASQAQGTFLRWTAGSTMARDLEAQAKVSLLKQAYFPVYMFKREVAGKEQVMVRPAKSTTLPGMRNLKVPPGDLKVFDQKYSYGDVEVQEPELQMGAYLESLPGTAVEQSLVFFPIWEISYTYRDRKFFAVVDGSSGEMFAMEYPPRQAAPYFLVAGAAFIVFAIEGLLIPAAGIGLMLACVTAPAVAAVGYYVAKNL